VRQLEAELISGRALYERVVLDAMVRARESVVIATANVKAMLVELDGTFHPIAVLFAKLAARGVSVRVLHAELPSRPFRQAFDQQAALVAGGMTLKLCPRVHFKAVLIDGAWLYLGSANLTGAGLGAKGNDARNFELGIVTEDFDTIDRVTAHFESIWSGAECRTCRLYDVCPDPIGPRPKKLKRKRAASNVVLGRSRRLRR
jgi:phosphatidylserine/phosphatidylglycerophosphate/cardiolipin synthase-like enzyme